MNVWQFWLAVCVVSMDISVDHYLLSILILAEVGNEASIAKAHGSTCSVDSDEAAHFVILYKTVDIIHIT